MLQNLRDKAQGWIAWVIIGLIAFTFVIFGTESLFNSRGDSQVVAKVQGTDISARELDIAYKRYLHQPGSESLAQLDPSFVKKELLQSMIDETIMMNGATKMGLRVSPQRINITLNSVPFFMVDGQFSEESYARFLANADYTNQSFRHLLQMSLLKQQLQQGLMQSSFSLTNDVESLIQFILQKRDVRYVTIPREPLEKEASIKEEDIKQYYDNHLKDFMTEEQVALEYVVLSLKDLMDQYHPQDDEIRAYYKENAASFNQPERIHVAHILISLPKNADEKTIAAADEKIKEIQKRIKAGESFEALAKEYSDDKASNANGGSLEWFIRGEMVPEFEKAAFALDKKDQISPPVKTEFGYHLIKLIEKQKEKSRDFGTVRDDILNKMKHEWAQEQLATKGDQLNDIIFDHPDSLQPAADKLGLTIQKTDLFTRSNGVKDPLLQNPIVMAAAFNPSVKDDKNNSEMLKLDDENYLVLRVSKLIPSKQKTLSDVTPEILKILKLKESTALASKQANEMFASIEKMKADQNRLLTQYSWKEQKDLTRQSTAISPDLVESAFSMPTPNGKEGDFKVVSLENGDAAVLWLTKVSDGSLSNLTKEEKENYQAQLTKHFGELEYALYATHLIKDAKVEKKLDNI